MKATFSLGRIAGVRIGLNWSVLVIAGLLALSLGSGILPAQAPGYAPSAYLLAGGLAAVGLLASILAHEIAHALVARRNGLEVDGITLWLFGGVAAMKGEMPDPRTEAKVAGAGPLTSVGVGLASGAVAFGLAAAGAPALLVAMFGWLGVINVVLAVFNLLPGAPLDGGRLLHAFLWWRSGDRLKATGGAATGGRIVGYGLMGFGLIEVVYFGMLGGLWTAMIGWFLAGAAGMEERQTVAHYALGDLRVRDVMDPEPSVTPGWVTIEHFLTNSLGRASLYAVEDFDGRIIGAVHLADLKRIPPDDRSTRRISEVARRTADIPLAGPDEAVQALVERMGNRPWALVFDEGRLVGVVTRADIATGMERGMLIAGQAGNRSGQAGNRSAQ